MQQITRKKMTKNNNNTCKRSFFVGWYDDNLWSYTFIPFYSKEFFLLKSLIFIRHAWFFIALYSHFSDCFSFQRKVCMTFNSICFGPGQEMDVFCVWIFNVPCLTDTMFVQFKRRLCVDGIRSVCIKLVILCNCTQSYL